ncbi:hypothetical protein Hanom_Chr15g01376471 [Helianthus anomalus]
MINDRTILFLILSRLTIRVLQVGIAPSVTLSLNTNFHCFTKIFHFPYRLHFFGLNSYVSFS